MFELSNIKCRFSRKFTHIDYFNISCTPLGGRSKSQFEPFTKNKTINLEKGEIETEIDKTGTANDKVETKNKKRGRPKGKNKNLTLTIQKFSNHIKFIDYIPTHEIITYRHLFAYGFYVE